MTEDFTQVAVSAVVARTDKAICLRLPDGAEAWVPLSLIEGEEEPPDDAESVSIASWFAERECLPGFDGVTVFRCSRKRTAVGPDLGSVTTRAFGPGRLLREDGDKMTVRFADGKVRTLGARYVTKV